MRSACSRSARPASAASRPSSCRQDFTFEEDEDDDVSMRWVEFNHHDLPQARPAKAGASPSARTIPTASSRPDVAWKVDVTETGIDWFDLDLGIEVDGEQRAAAAASARPVQAGTRGADARPRSTQFGDEPVYGTLPDGRLLPIPASRLKAMLEALYELFASRRIDDDGSCACAGPR